MNENEQKAGSVADQKSKIRERYKGIDPDELDVIPALPQEDIFAVENEQRVAVYARVSTDDPRQTSSYELQKNHYHDVISKSPNWKLVQIYADEGISGTSLQHRDQFKLMIEDCKKGQIDLIVTKSVSGQALFSVHHQPCPSTVPKPKSDPVKKYFYVDDTSQRYGHRLRYL